MPAASVTKLPVTCAVNNPCRPRKPTVSTNPALKLKSRVMTELFIGRSCLRAFYIFVVHPNAITGRVVEKERASGYGVIGIQSTPPGLRAHSGFPENLG